MTIFHPTCPKCGGDRIYRSRRRNLIEKVLALAGAKTRRCHACDARFVQLGGSLIRVTDVRAALGRIAFAGGVLIAAALVLAVILWIDRAQSNSAPESRLTAPGAAGQLAWRSC